MQKLQGIAVSPGVAIGEALVMDNEGFRIPRRFVARDTPSKASWNGSTRPSDRRQRGNRSHNRDAVSQELGNKYGAIFEAHLQMLERCPTAR